MANAQYDRGNQTLFHPEDPPMANLRRVAFVMMSFVDNYTSPLARNPHDTTIGFLLVQQWWFSFERRSTPAPDDAECCLYRIVLKTTNAPPYSILFATKRMCVQQVSRCEAGCRKAVADNELARAFDCQRRVLPEIAAR